MAWRKLLFAVFGLVSLAAASAFFLYKERHPAGAAQLLAKTMRLKLPDTTLGDHRLPAPDDAILFDAKGDYALIGKHWKGAVADSELAGGATLVLTKISGKQERKVSDVAIWDAFFDASGATGYFVTNTFDVFRFTVPGGAPEKIAERAVMPMLSPDGKKLVYQKLGPQWVPGEAFDSSLGLTVLTVAKKQEKRITERWEDYLPTWMPDSHGVLFFTPDARGNLLPASIGADGEGRILLGAPAAAHVAIPSERPRWSADGKAAIFESDRQISLISFDDQRRHITAIETLGYGKHPEWSPDGKSVRFLVGAGDDFDDSTSVRVDLHGNILK